MLEELRGRPTLGTRIDEVEARLQELADAVEARLVEPPGAVEAFRPGQDFAATQLAAFGTSLSQLSSAVEGLRRAQDSIAAQLAALRTSLEETAVMGEALKQAQESVLEKLGAQHAAVRDTARCFGTALDEVRRQTEVRAVMDWIARAAVEAGPLVSVVLPTRNRRRRLERAIESVEIQTYPNWELLIVNDGSTDDTQSFLNARKHDRLRCFEGSGRGACAARNIALREARGDLVAYLDDDNLMHTEWLKSIVWAFAKWPDANVLYGAFIVDDPARIDRRGEGKAPRLYFYRYDHHGVANNNIADMGCIAHHARLPEAKFDESLREMGDWDLFLRLTRDAPPVSLPAIACYYTTDAPDRLSHGPTCEADLAKVRAMNKR